MQYIQSNMVNPQFLIPQMPMAPVLPDIGGIISGITEMLTRLLIAPIVSLQSGQVVPDTINSVLRSDGNIQQFGLTMAKMMLQRTIEQQTLELQTKQENIDNSGSENIYV